MLGGSWDLMLSESLLESDMIFSNLWELLEFLLSEIGVSSEIIELALEEKPDRVLSSLKSLSSKLTADE